MWNFMADSQLKMMDVSMISEYLQPVIFKGKQRDKPINYTNALIKRCPIVLDDLIEGFITNG